MTLDADAWLSSQARARLVAEAGLHASGELRTRYVPGLEGWLTQPGSRVLVPPAHWRTVVVSAVALLPLLEAISYLLATGIGKAIAAALTAGGARVLVNHNHTAEPAEKVVAGIEAGGGAAMAVAADVSSRAEYQAWWTGCWPPGAGGTFWSTTRQSRSLSRFRRSARQSST